MATDTDGGSRVLVIAGPTACGKTRRAVDCALALDGEVVSADSRQVYRGMDIGTGKDLEEYGTVPCHLVDIVPAGYRYTLYEWLRDARAALAAIRSRRRLPIVCGGTGLYFESLLRGVTLPQVPANGALRASLQGLPLDELARRLRAMKTLHNVTDIDTPQRAIRAIEIQQYYLDHPAEAALALNPQPLEGAVVVALEIGRDERRARITERLHRRLAQGMADEVRALLASGLQAADLEYYGLEYKYLTLYVTGSLSRDEMVSGLETAIHRFAKRQMTWLRGMERRGITVHRLPHDMGRTEFVTRVKELLAC